jgi:hypothetical protein
MDMIEVLAHRVVQRRLVILDRQGIDSSTVDDLRRDVFLSWDRLSDLPSMATTLSLRGYAISGEVAQLNRCGVYGHSPRLAPRRLTGTPAAFDGSWCALVLSRKEGGLITGACGLGRPHYGQSLHANFRLGLIGYATLPVIDLNRGWF